MLSMQSDPRLQQYHHNQQLQQQQQQQQQVQLVPYNDDSLSVHSVFGGAVAAASSSSALVNLTLSQDLDSHEGSYGNMENAWKEKGNVDAAIRYYLFAIELQQILLMHTCGKGCQALALNPRLVDAHSNLSNLMKIQGFVQEAYNCYLEALRIQSNFAIA